MAWGLTRGQLIDTPKSAYGETVSGLNESMDRVLTSMD